ncbi:hypothetical protein PIROE2DRAFT_61497 [Piromyces sp. E2]|nr:hypothetical protein PIROE2DRAFT_61497 [Piromyces sp. E2]|eukprot:OUM63069.1 hypothetical protein PIROE2DRAFT_61497 [Piromyces sp. E2]
MSNMVNQNFEVKVKTGHEYKMIYISPECLSQPNVKEYIKKMNVSMVVVDDANYLLPSYTNFKPYYTDIPRLIHSLPERPMKSGIILCHSNDKADDLYQILLSFNIPITRYHTGLDQEEREENKNSFIQNKKPYMIMTCDSNINRKINKYDIRFVLHFNLPITIYHYYSEIGLGGRDKRKANCVLLYNQDDISYNKTHCNNDSQLKLNIQTFERYCKEFRCYHSFIQKCLYNKVVQKCTSFCDNCCHSRIAIDMTKEAKIVLQCVRECGFMDKNRKIYRYGKNSTVDILKGLVNNENKYRKEKLIEKSTYGRLKNYSKYEISLLIEKMITKKYINIIVPQLNMKTLELGNTDPVEKTGEIVLITIDKNSTVVDDWRREELISDIPQECTLYDLVKPPINKNLYLFDGGTSNPITALRKSHTDKLIYNGQKLLGELLKLQRDISKQNHKVICSTESIIEMSIKQPKNIKELLLIEGVTENHVNVYGKKFLNLINKYKISRHKIISEMANDIERDYDNFFESHKHNPSTVMPNESGHRPDHTEKKKEEGINNNNNNNNNNNHNPSPSSLNEGKTSSNQSSPGKKRLVSETLPETTDNKKRKCKASVDEPKKPTSTGIEKDVEDNYDMFDDEIPDDILNMIHPTENEQSLYWKRETPGSIEKPDDGNVKEIKNENPNHTNEIDDYKYLSKYVKTSFITSPEISLQLLKELQQLRHSIGLREHIKEKDIMSDEIVDWMSKHPPQYEHDLLSIKEINGIVHTHYINDILSIFCQYLPHTSSQENFEGDSTTTTTTKKDYRRRRKRKRRTHG